MVEEPIATTAPNEPNAEELSAFLTALRSSPDSPFNRGPKPRLKQFRLLEHFVNARRAGELNGLWPVVRAFEYREAGLEPKCWFIRLEEDDPRKTDDAKFIQRGLKVFKDLRRTLEVLN